jgi:hypothetical protein
MQKIRKDQALRMTALWGLEIELVGYAENTKYRKLTGPQDDGFVGP